MGEQQIDNYIYNKPFRFLRKNRKGSRAYYSKAVALDTETSNDGTMSHIHLWTMAFNGGYYIGKTPKSLVWQLNRLARFYNTNDENRLVIFIHNLPYDLSYLLEFFCDEWGEPTNLLATSPHKAFNISFRNGLEFRCSYKLTNDSLANAQAKYNTTLRKLEDIYDYEKYVNQRDNHSSNDLLYAIRDVTSLDELITKINKVNNDSIATMPITSTGYVRREIQRKKAELEGKDNHNNSNCTLKRFTPTAREYNFFRPAFAGGFTHVNRKRRGEIVCGKIRHRDFRSMYPSILRVCSYFPVEPFKKYSDIISLKELENKRSTHCILVKVLFNNIKIKDHITAPYIAISKILKTDSYLYNDNGRLLQCKGIIEYTCDIKELDLILEQYNCDFVIEESYIALAGALPKYILDVIDEHYYKKTYYKKLSHTLKEIYTKEPTIDNYIAWQNAETQLMKSKNILNGIYGVLATDPVREDITVKAGEWKVKKRVNMTSEELEELLTKHYKKRSTIAYYGLGIYTTINTRLELFDMIKICGYDNYIYCDTDSIFYISNDEIEAKYEHINKKWYDEAIANKFYILYEEKPYTYHAFDDEDEDITRFKALHSKCYMYECEGSLNLTIAGIMRDNKKKGKELVKNWEELKKDGSNLDAFRRFEEGFKFKECAGSTSKYVSNKDVEESERIFTYNGNITAGGCIIQKTEKEIRNTIEDVIDREFIEY